MRNRKCGTVFDLNVSCVGVQHAMNGSGFRSFVEMCKRLQATSTNRNEHDK